MAPEATERETNMVLRARDMRREVEAFAEELERDS
jgi:hypothetical protein